MVVELLVIGGIGLAAGGWLLSRRGQPPSDSGIDPVFTPYTSAPPGCAVAPDEREGAAVANERRDGAATCGVQDDDGDGDGEADCGDSDGSDGGSDSGGDSSSD